MWSVKFADLSVGSHDGFQNLDDGATNKLDAALAAFERGIYEFETLRKPSPKPKNRRDAYDRTPDDRQTFRPLYDQCHEWASFHPHIWVRGQAVPPAGGAGAEETPAPTRPFSAPTVTQSATASLEVVGRPVLLTPLPAMVSPHEAPPEHQLLALMQVQGLQTPDSNAPGGSAASPTQALLSGWDLQGGEVLACQGSDEEVFAVQYDTWEDHLPPHMRVHAVGGRRPGAGAAGHQGESATGATAAAATAAAAAAGLLLGLGGPPAGPGRAKERDGRAVEVGLPPVAPWGALRDQVVDELLPQLWHHLAPVLAPAVHLLLAQRRAAAAQGLKPGRRSALESDFQAITFSDDDDDADGFMNHQPEGFPGPTGYDSDGGDDQFFVGRQGSIGSGCSFGVGAGGGGGGGGGTGRPYQGVGVEGEPGEAPWGGAQDDDDGDDGYGGPSPLPQRSCAYLHPHELLQQASAPGDLSGRDGIDTYSSAPEGGAGNGAWQVQAPTLPRHHTFHSPQQQVPHDSPAAALGHPRPPHIHQLQQPHLSALHSYHHHQQAHEQQHGGDLLQVHSMPHPLPPLPLDQVAAQRAGHASTSAPPPQLSARSFDPLRVTGVHPAPFRIAGAAAEPSLTLRSEASFSGPVVGSFSGGGGTAAGGAGATLLARLGIGGGRGSVTSPGAAAVASLHRSSRSFTHGSAAAGSSDVHHPASSSGQATGHAARGLPAHLLPFNPNSAQRQLSPGPGQWQGQVQGAAHSAAASLDASGTRGATSHAGGDPPLPSLSSPQQVLSSAVLLHDAGQRRVSMGVAPAHALPMQALPVRGGAPQQLPTLPHPPHLVPLAGQNQVVSPPMNHANANSRPTLRSGQLGTRSMPLVVHRPSPQGGTDVQGLLAAHSQHASSNVHTHSGHSASGQGLLYAGGLGVGGVGASGGSFTRGAGGLGSSSAQASKAASSRIRLPQLDRH